MARNQRRKIATGDCESDPFKLGRIPKPFIWCIYDGEDHHIFNTAQEMVNFLRDKKWIVYFHNGGKFDYFFMLEYLEPFDYVMNINGRLAKFKIGDCEFRDSYNLFPLPLSAYRKDDFDYTKLEENVRQKYWWEIIGYLQNDCTYLYEIVIAFVEKYGVNLTLAASAFKFYNSNFAESPNQKTNAMFYDKFTPFYYGGRVECFKKGIINYPVKCIDINSAYPKAMMENHPYGGSFETLYKLPEDGIGRCFIELEAESRGAFPFRQKGESLAFPNDGLKRHFFITGWEYLAAKEMGDLRGEKIIRVYRFFQKINFGPYINHFYDLKNTALDGSPDYIISKLFLNSLYGKYASNPAKYKETYICPMEYINDSCELLEMEYAGQLGPWAILECPLPDVKQNFYNVATAASITGYVRAFLYKSMRQCEGVVYCDTDSIFCKDTGALKLSDKLGDWKLEGKFTAGGGVAGKKLYAFEFAEGKKKGKFKIASKGARLDHSEILRVCQGEEILYKSEAPTFSLKKDVFFLERKIRMT